MMGDLPELPESRNCQKIQIEKLSTPVHRGYQALISAIFGNFGHFWQFPHFPNEPCN